MPNWKKVILSGSDAILNDITASGGISASSYHGDGSNLTGVNGFPFTGSAAITGNLDVTGSFNISGSINLTNENPTAGAFLHISSSGSNAIRIETEGSPNQHGAQLFIHGNKQDGAPARTTIIELKGDDTSRARGIEFTATATPENPDSYNLKKWYAGTTYNTNGYTIGYASNGVDPEYLISSSFFVDDNRKIGIGTTTPRAKLGIEFNGGHTSGDVQIANSTLDLYNPLEANTDEKGSILTFSDNYEDTSGFQKTIRAAIKGGTDTTGNTADGFLAFYTDASTADSATERMRIDHDGNVGIGTTSPNSKLEVIGSTSDTAASALQIRDSSLDSLLSVRNDGRVDIPNGVLNVGGNTTVDGGNLRVDNGNLQISHSSVGGIGGQFEQPTTSLLTFRFDSDRFRFWAGGTERLTILSSSGNVGIGNNTPPEKLTVEGNISASGTITADSLTLLGLSLVDNNAAVISGSNIFGSDAETDFHQFTGSLDITGSVTAESLVSRHSITSSVGFRVGSGDRPLRLTGGSTLGGTQPTIDAPGHDKIVIGATNDLMLGNNKKIFFDNGILSSIGPLTNEPETILLNSNAGLIIQSDPINQAGFIELREPVTASIVSSSGHFSFGDDSKIQKPTLGDINLEIRNSYGNSTDPTATLKFGHGNGLSTGGKIVSIREDNYVTAGQSHSALAFYTAFDGGDVEQLRISSNGNITASANISSSGVIEGLSGSFKNLDVFDINSAANPRVRIGRQSDQVIQFSVTDTVNTIEAIQDSDSNSAHSFILKRTFAGTGANDFIIQKGSTDQLRIDTDNNITASGDISSSGESTASFGTYFGDGSNLEGISGFPFTGSAIISGGLAITGALDISGSLTFNGDTTIGTVGGHSLTIEPEGNLHLGNSNQTDLVKIGRESGGPAGRVEIHANSATIAAKFATESIEFNHAITASVDISSSANLIINEVTSSGGMSVANDTILLIESSDSTPELFIDGHITASGDISASGDLTINEITSSGNITSSGTISSDGTITSNSNIISHGTVKSNRYGTRSGYTFHFDPHTDNVNFGTILQIHSPGTVSKDKPMGSIFFRGEGGVGNSVLEQQSVTIRAVGTEDQDSTENNGGQAEIWVTPTGTETSEKTFTVNAESGSIAHTKLRTPALILTPTSSESDPTDNAIIYPQSGNMTPADALAITRTIGKDLKFGETEKGTITISSSLGGTRNSDTAQADVYIPLFKTPIKNSQVKCKWTITAINDDNEVFANAIFEMPHTGWISGSMIDTNSVDFDSAAVAVERDFDDLDNGNSLPSHVFGWTQHDVNENTRSEGNYYLLGHTVEELFHPQLSRATDFAHTSNWDNDHGQYWTSQDNSLTGEIFNTNNIIRRFRWGGPTSIDGEDHLFFRWENNTSDDGLGTITGWRGVRLIIQVDYEISNYRI